MANWKETFMKAAVLVAEHSTCSKIKVGAILVKDRRIISTGYNGTFSKCGHCCDIFDEISSKSPEHTEWARKYEVHAEINCLLYAALNNVSPEGADLYVTYSPCVDCAKAIITSKIKNVYYLNDFRDLEGVYLLREFLTIEKINLEGKHV